MEKLYHCDCGIVLDLEKLKLDQYDFNARRQHYECPVCKTDIPVKELELR